MPQFAVNTHRFDPYKNFKFRVKWDGNYTPLASCQQDITFLESLRDSAKKVEGNNLAVSYPSNKKVSFLLWLNIYPQECLVGPGT